MTKTAKPSEFNMREGEALANLLMVRRSEVIADELQRRDDNADKQMLLVKACEHIANGDEGWEKLRNECPSTTAVAALRDKYREALGKLAYWETNHG